MSILSEINTLLAPLGVPVETGVFTDTAPDEYIVVIPLDDTFDYFADNRPMVDVHEARISIYSKGNYLKLKNDIVRAFIDADYTITARQYLGFEPDTGYHHFNVDVAQYYETEDI
jgi:hypothetical protein